MIKHLFLVSIRISRHCCETTQQSAFSCVRDLDAGYSPQDDPVQVACSPRKSKATKCKASKAAELFSLPAVVVLQEGFVNTNARSNASNIS